MSKNKGALGEENYENMQKCLDKTKDWELYKWMNNNLTIIDGKCSSILQIASIKLVILTMVYSSIIDIDERGALEVAIKIILLVPLFLLVWTIISLLRILYIYWSDKEEYFDMKRTIGILCINPPRMS